MVLQMKATFFVALFLLSSCAATVPPMKKGISTCLPPGVPVTFKDWDSRNVVVALIGENGARLLGVYVMYQRNHSVVAAYWLNGKVVVFDPAPRDPGVPMFYNTAYMGRVGNSKIRVRAKPGSECSWKRFKVPGLRTKQQGSAI